MKLFLALLLLLGTYLYVLLQSTNLVLAQTQQLSRTYQSVASQADQLAASR